MKGGKRKKSTDKFLNELQIFVFKQEPFLAVPPLTKQFLISPPVSPPVGWEQVKRFYALADIHKIYPFIEGPVKEHFGHP